MIEPPPRRGAAWRRPWVVALVACSAVAVVFAAGVWTHLSTRWLGYTGDPQQTTWFLRWTPYALGHGWNPLLTTHIASPDGANLMWNSSVPLLGVLLAPVTLWLGPVAAYNLALVLVVALGGFACWAALRRVGGLGVGAALAGAVFYEVSPYVTAHALGQLNLSAAVTPPLVLLLVHEILVRRRLGVRRAGVLLGSVAAAQAFVSEEMLVSTALACVVLLVVMALVCGDRHLVAERALRGLRALAWALAVFVPLLAAPLWVQFAGPQALRSPVQEPGVFVTDLANLVVPTQSQLVAPQAALDFSQRFSGNPVEWAGYLGLPVLLVLAWVAVRAWDSRRVRVALWCVVAFVVLSLGPGLHVAGHDTGVPLPWAAIERIPLLRDMLPGRMMLYADLAVALLLGVAVARVAALRAVIRRRAALLLALACATVLPSLPLPTDTVPVPAFFTSAAVERLPGDGSVLVLPFTTDFTSDAPMVWQAVAGLGYRMPSGYAMIPDSAGVSHVGVPPTPLSTALRGIALGRVAPPSSDDQALLTDLRRWDVRAAVVGPMPHRDVALRFLTALLGCAPQQVDGVSVWWHAGADGCG